MMIVAIAKTQSMLAILVREVDHKQQTEKVDEVESNGKNYKPKHTLLLAIGAVIGVRVIIVTVVVQIPIGIITHLVVVLLVVMQLFSSSVSLRFFVCDSVGLIGLVFEHSRADDVVFIHFGIVGHFISFLEEFFGDDENQSHAH